MVFLPFPDISRCVAKNERHKTPVPCPLYSSFVTRKTCCALQDLLPGGFSILPTHTIFMPEAIQNQPSFVQRRILIFIQHAHKFSLQKAAAHSPSLFPESHRIFPLQSGGQATARSGAAEKSRRPFQQNTSLLTGRPLRTFCRLKKWRCPLCRLLAFPFFNLTPNYAQQQYPSAEFRRRTLTASVTLRTFSFSKCPITMYCLLSASITFRRRPRTIFWYFFSTFILS